MKQRFIIITSIFMMLLLEQCATNKKVQYDFPAAMSDYVRADFTKQCDKGQVLYSLNCAKCHNKKIHGREVIPDFTREQLKGYELRISNAQHEASMPDELVTAEELGYISTFLIYKKKNK